MRGRDVAQLGERRTGTTLRQVRFPRCGKRFLLQESTFSAGSLTVSVHPRVQHLGAYVKDPVVHVRVRWILETQTPSMHRTLGSATMSQLAFSGKSTPNFPWEKSQRDNTVVNFLFFLKRSHDFKLNFRTQLAAHNKFAHTACTAL